MTIHTIHHLREIDSIPNLERDVRDDAAWLRLDIMDHGIARYETTTNERGETKSVRVKIREDRA